MKAGDTQLVSSPQTPSFVRVRVLPLIKSLHTLTSIMYKSLMGAINAILTCLACDIDGRIATAKQSGVSAALFVQSPAESAVNGDGW